MGEVSSPAPHKPNQCQKGQQAVTKYIRHDSSNSKAGKAHEHKAAAPAVQSEATAEDSLLKAKPVNAGQSIAAALLRQTRRKASANDVPALQAKEAVSVLALDLRQATHTGEACPTSARLYSGGKYCNVDQHSALAVNVSCTVAALGLPAMMSQPQSLILWLRWVLLKDQRL